MTSLDHIFHFGDGREVEIGQPHVQPHSEFDGKTSITSNLRTTHNVHVLAIKEPNGKIRIAPSPDMIIQPHHEAEDMSYNV